MRVTLYVGGLEAQVDDGRLRRLFGEFGSISDTRVVTGDDGRCRGFAYVTFEDDLKKGKDEGEKADEGQDDTGDDQSPSND